VVVSLAVHVALIMTLAGLRLSKMERPVAASYQVSLVTMPVVPHSEPIVEPKPVEHEPPKALPAPPVPVTPPPRPQIVKEKLAPARATPARSRTATRCADPCGSPACRRASAAGCSTHAAGSSTDTDTGAGGTAPAHATTGDQSRRAPRHRLAAGGAEVCRCAGAGGQPEGCAEPGPQRGGEIVEHVEGSRACGSAAAVGRSAAAGAIASQAGVGHRR